LGLQSLGRAQDLSLIRRSFGVLGQRLRHPKIFHMAKS
ncbi:hypothetical protein BAE44_0007643, partial [Dichanthelium oligosanthes]